MIDELFRQLTGFEPFPWQRRLAEELVAGRQPTVLDVSTGLGKTSVMAIWLAAHLQGATLPRRLVYIVDRRVVVDQATAEAEKLHDALSARFCDKKLSISTLRGAHVDNREWLKDPAALAIIVGTVDMIGSRLLFSGYGVSRAMRPPHAGTLGQDTFFALDEAHLVPPFEALLGCVTAGGTALRAADSVLPEPRFMALSATQRGGSGSVFSLDESDHQHPVVAKRINAVKRLSTTRVESKKVRPAIVERAKALLDSHPRARLAIFCNARKLAEDVASDLSKGKTLQPERIVMLTGARRVLERTRAAESLDQLGFTGPREQRDDEPAVLVATAAGEVGVDFDADHAVMDIVPWERMVQRLGRVNRRGECGDTQVMVIDPGEAVADWEKTHGGDPGAVRNLIAKLPIDGDLPSAGPEALRKVSAAFSGDAEAGSSPVPLHPPLDRATLDAFSLTGLPGNEHTARPDVAPWLRGWAKEDPPQCTVVWRAHMPTPDTADEDLEGFFRAAAPHLSEKLDTGAVVVSDWLHERAKSLLEDKNKAKGKVKVDSEAGELPNTGQHRGLSKDSLAAVLLGPEGIVIRSWNREEFLSLADQSKQKRDAAIGQFSNAVLVVSARLGGLNPHGMLDAKVDEPPPTADEGDWADVDISWRVGLERAQKTSAEDASSDAPDDADSGETPAMAVPPYHETFRIVYKTSGDDEPESWLVVDRKRPEEDELSGTAHANHYVSLKTHSRDVARRVAEMGAQLDLPPRYCELLQLAAQLHDIGKDAKVWQSYAQADGAPEHLRPIAKTPKSGHWSELRGYRHEFGSVVNAQKLDEFNALNDEERDFVLHLVASHHGHARPFIRPDGFDDAPPSTLEGEAREVTLRFERMQRRWGPWGLAWWEALLRAADRAASEDPSKEPADG